MRQFSFPLFFLVSFCFSSCGSNQEDKLYGTWKQVQPAYKQEQIKMAFEKNKKAIDDMINVPDDLVEKYGTRNLDTLKQRMLEDLKFQYQIENAYSYKFSKDGFLSLLNEKNGAEKKLYKFGVNDDELELNLIEDSSDFSESLFEGGSSLSIRNSDKDSIILIDYAGTMSDTIFFKRIK